MENTPYYNFLSDSDRQNIARASSELIEAASELNFVVLGYPNSTLNGAHDSRISAAAAIGYAFNKSMNTAGSLLEIMRGLLPENDLRAELAQNYGEEVSLLLELANRLPQTRYIVSAEIIYAEPELS